MALSDRVIERISLGPLEGAPTLWSNPTLTTSTKVTLPNAAAQSTSKFIRLVITNGSTSAYIAWTLVAFGAANPNITADFNATTGGAAIPPGGQQEMVIEATNDMYVAAASSSPVNVVSFYYST